MAKPSTFSGGTFRELLWKYSRDRYQRDPQYKGAVKKKIRDAKSEKENTNEK